MSSIQQRIINSMMNKYIQNKSEIRLSDIVAIKRDIENEETDEKFFLIGEQKYKIILAKIDKLQKENDEMQELMLEMIKLLQSNLNKK
tara:strand:- start:887 stop:1150 length:264 start_codon:yes stop_codon:yes gene_type:complete